jgi:xanthine dehydrogenase small subunit
MRDYLLIHVNGQRHEVRGQRAFQSLSDFLRYDLHLIGTKVVCAEGDCGSCSVFIGTPAGERIDYRSVTSCIQFMYQLDCMHIITVEGLVPPGELNAVQEAMVRCGGSQCGFCTPGFVVSLCGLVEQNRSATSAEVQAACVGNLCRCTGYEPILRAGTEVDWRGVRPLNELYPPRPILENVAAALRHDVSIRWEDRVFFKPADVYAAVQFKAQHPGCVAVAGGTDLGVQINKGIRDPKVVMSLLGIDELRGIQRDGDTLVVGALATLAELERACAQALPEYARLLYWFGSPPIRNAATLGGNIANGSPIGDTMPALYVLNAEIELTGTRGARRVNINEFYAGYRKTVASPDELITRVFIPLPRDGEVFKLYKVSRRKDLDISAFTAAFWMRIDGRHIAEARIAYGGVGPTIIRLRQTEKLLETRPLAYQTLCEAGRMARTEISPISDVRGSADYRSQLAENMMKKLWFDIAGGDGPDGNGQHDGDGLSSRQREQWTVRT